MPNHARLATGREMPRGDGRGKLAGEQACNSQSLAVRVENSLSKHVQVGDVLSWGGVGSLAGGGSQAPLK